MTDRHTDTSLGFGVYFAPDDYVGFGPRLMIFLIDGTVLVATILAARSLGADAMDAAWLPFVLLSAVAGWLYLVPLKRSATGTIGYRCLGCRLVALDGKSPSIFMMTFRLLFWLFGPLNFVLDFIWCGIDQDRQTLRDRYAGVCVVKSDACPAGSGPIHLAYYDAMGYNLMLAHVVHASSESDADSDDQP